MHKKGAWRNAFQLHKLAELANFVEVIATHQYG